MALQASLTKTYLFGLHSHSPTVFRTNFAMDVDKFVNRVQETRPLWNLHTEFYHNKGISENDGPKYDCSWMW
jgi:hypothetical protein